jgi:acyl carrier protein
MTNGKVNRHVLRRLKNLTSQRKRVAPQIALEEKIAAVWAEVLEQTPIGIHDDFFLMGGHSLAAIRIALRLSELLDKPIPVRYIFDAPTISALADKIGGAADRGQQAIRTENK